LSTNFGDYDDAKLDEFLKGLNRLDAAELEIESAKKVSDAKVASYTFLSSETNV
jgi:hypothetical protein